MLLSKTFDCVPYRSLSVICHGPKTKIFIRITVTTMVGNREQTELLGGPGVRVILHHIPGIGGSSKFCLILSGVC